MTGCCRPRKGDAVEPVPVQAGSIIGMGNTIDSAASTQPYTAKYGGFDGSWESPTVSPAKAVAGKGPSLPAPLAELKALLQRNQLPLLPGFLVEKADNLTLEEACDLGTILSRVPATDISPDQEVPMFLMTQAVVARLLEALKVEGSLEQQRWRQSCATGVKHALQMMQDMERTLADEKSRRVQAENDCAVLLASLRRTGKPGRHAADQSMATSGLGRASIWQRSGGVPPDGWFHWDLPRLNAAATRIQRLHRGNTGRRRYEQHCKAVLRAVDPAFDPELSGCGRRRPSTRRAASTSGYSEIQMASVLRRHCHELEGKLSAATHTLDAMRDEVQELISANDGLRETNKQLEEMSQLRTELASEKEAARLLRKEGATMRRELNSLRPDADLAGARQRPNTQGLSVLVADSTTRELQHGAAADAGTEVDDWASLPSIPVSPMMAEFGGPKPPYERGHEPMPAARLQESIELPVALQQQLPPFPKSPLKSPARKLADAAP